MIRNIPTADLLFGVSRPTNKGYVVEVGNQRLQALLDLKIPLAPCKIKGE